MPRYSLYEGVKGQLAPHPAARIASRRHPGMSRRPLAEGEVFESLVDLYEPCQEVFEVHKCLTRAVETGSLKLVAGPVVAKDHVEALAKLQKLQDALVAAPKPKAPKSGGTDQ